MLEASECLFYRTSFDGCFYTFWKHLFLQDTSKWLLLSSWSSLILRITQKKFFHSYWKNPKKTPAFSLPWRKKMPSLLFIIFSWLLFTPTLFQSFSLPTKLKDFVSLNPIPGGRVIFTSLIYLRKYLTDSAQNWPEGKSRLQN